MSEEDFAKLLPTDKWEIRELDISTLKAIPKVVRREDIFGGFVSGDYSAAKTLNKQSAVAGFDILVYENTPDRARGESNINAYHYIVKKSGHSTFPYVLMGPFRDDTIIGHWPSDLNLSGYGKNP
jgi:hypothetical protein